MAFSLGRREKLCRGKISTRLPGNSSGHGSDSGRCKVRSLISNPQLGIRKITLLPAAALTRYSSGYLQLHQDSSYTSHVPGYGCWRDGSALERRGFGGPLGSLRATGGGNSGVNEVNATTHGVGWHYYIRRNFLHSTRGSRGHLHRNLQTWSSAFSHAFIPSVPNL